MKFVRIRNLFQSDYFRNIVTVLTGAGLRQLLPILISPLLTRIFSPSDFAILGVYLSITAILCSFNTGKFELAILLPKDLERSIDVAQTSRLVNLMVSVVLLIAILIFFLFSDFTYAGYNLLSIALIISFSSLIKGEYSVSSYQIIRAKNFLLLSKNKVLISVLVSVFSVGFGYLSWGSKGLILSEILSSGLGVLALLIYLRKKKFFLLEVIPFSKFTLVANKYSHFPKFSVVSDLLTMCSIHFPLLFLTAYFDDKEAGYYSVLYRVLSVPISLLASSILDVFKEEASKSWRESHNFWSIYKRTLRALVLLGLIPFIIIMVGGPLIFEVVFGEGWERAGEFAQILAPMFLIRFITLPLSFSLQILERQREILFWSILIFGFTLSSLFLGRFLYNSIDGTLSAFCTSYSFIFAAYFGRTFWLVRKFR